MSTDSGSVRDVRPPRSQQIVRRVKEQMGGQDLSNQELGQRTGIHRVTIGRSLGGHRQFTIDELELIADALGVDFDWLITGNGSPAGPVPPAGFEPAAFRSEEQPSKTLADVLIFPQSKTRTAYEPVTVERHPTATLAPLLRINR